MSDTDFLAERFEAHRPRLRAVAYRMLGSLAEAEDAVQEAWFRLSRSEAGDIGNLGGWLTTVVGRVCLDLLRSRASRREEPLEEDRRPVPVAGPEQDALLADSVGGALLVVLGTLTPAERLAFVLHDLFGVPFEEIAVIADRTPTAARQLASRARRRVRGAEAPRTDLERRREVVDAFLAAARDGDFDGLLRVLDPDVVARAAGGVTTGARAVARGATSFAHLARTAGPALVGGVPGVVVRDAAGHVERVLAFTVVRDRVAVIEVVSEPERLAALDIAPAP
ncbi:sigma-70 family RNA polymerase sigma factor [Streptomyces sp. JB150]|uniref:sigma-70 family RNA polymerase sigma factor n=1 Tax=Streptomyces sp. JB150 TaxID=2714844 RepID=UPI0014077B97|nr:sigma-70 family RNA polymerase sigma factor [Streptomyces sp. JB150]QIJ63369.1 sigma-70 family RNA polymerase sigma factor [Streptomyces sp. JB150]